MGAAPRKMEIPVERGENSGLDRAPRGGGNPHSRYLPPDAHELESVTRATQALRLERHSPGPSVARSCYWGRSHCLSHYECTCTERTEPQLPTDSSSPSAPLSALCSCHSAFVRICPNCWRRLLPSTSLLKVLRPRVTEQSSRPAGHRGHNVGHEVSVMVIAIF